MNIAIFGAGALGSFLGGLLALAGERVFLISRCVEHVQSIQHQGLTLRFSEQTLQIPIPAFTALDRTPAPDLVFLGVKSYDTLNASREIRRWNPDAILLTLQNGVDSHPTLQAHWQQQQLITGVTSQGCCLSGPGIVTAANRGQVTLGVHSRNLSAAETVSQLFNRANIPTKTNPNPAGIIWTKLLANAGINALTALTGLPNGDLLRYRQTRQLLVAAVQETANVARAAGIRLETPDPVQSVLAIAAATASNRSSMLQDFDRGRPTEIDAINGAVSRKGQQLGILTPVNSTLTRLIKEREAAVRNGIYPSPLSPAELFLPTSL